MIQQLTPDILWQGMLQDEMFATRTDGVKAVYRQIFDPMVGILEDLLPQEVTLQTLFEAKRRFFNHILENDFTRKVDEAAPDEDFVDIDRETHTLIITIHLRSLVSMIALGLRLQGNNANRILNSLLLTGKGSLKDEALGRFRQGKLTIGELLVLQPTTVFNDRLI